MSIPKLELGEPLRRAPGGARWGETCRSWNAPDGAEFARLLLKRCIRRFRERRKQLEDIIDYNNFYKKSFTSKPVKIAKNCIVVQL